MRNKMFVCLILAPLMSLLAVHSIAQKAEKGSIDALNGWKQSKGWRGVGIHPNDSVKGLNIHLNNPVDGRVMIEGIPFLVLTGQPNAQATPMKEPGEIAFDLNREASAVYLFMGAQYEDGLTTVSHVERFVTRVEYADGFNDLIFPSRLPEGVHEIGQSPAVYKIRPTHRSMIRRLAVVDTMNSGRFLVLAVTTGPDIPNASETKSVKSGKLKKWDLPLPQGAVASQNIGLLVDSGGQQASLLINRTTGVSWIKASTPLYEIKTDGKVATQLKIKALPGGEIELTLEIRNASAKPLKVLPTFPVLRGLSAGGDPQQLGYCFPRLGAAISTLPTSQIAIYGAHFPVQFVDVYYPGAGGIYLMTHDTESWGKTFWLNKNTEVEMGVYHQDRTMQPGETWTLPPAVIGAHKGDWHEALHAYRQWVATWYKPAVPRKQWFREVFNFSQDMLSKRSGYSGMFDPKTKQFSISEHLREDAKYVGGVDYLHIFDWYAGGEDQEHGLGDYEPWDYFGGADRLKSEIAKIKNMGIPVGVYIQGVFIDKRGKIGTAHAKEWEMLKADLKPYPFPWVTLSAICAYPPAWQDHLVQTYERINRLLDPSGLYMDSVGWGDWLCYNPNHGHPVPGPRAKGEVELVRRIRAAVPANKVTYSEELGSDVATQYSDGTFTYSSQQADPKLSPTRINLSRFMFPDYKAFGMLWNDLRAGDDVHLAKQIFFSGDGFYIGTDIPAIFSVELAPFVKHAHQILRQHRDAFTSLAPEPLVPTLNTEVYANRFPGKNKTVWTFYNSAFTTVRGEMLEVAHVPGTRYHDAWNGRPIQPRIVGDKAIISLEIGPHDVGCLVALEK